MRIGSLLLEYACSSGQYFQWMTMMPPMPAESDLFEHLRSQSSRNSPVLHGCVGLAPSYKV